MSDIEYTSEQIADATKWYKEVQELKELKQEIVKLRHENETLMNIIIRLYTQGR